MNKIIPFVKTITLNERFDEITKIALDDTLKLEDAYTIKGDLIVRGCYKVGDKEEAFSYPIPVEIAIDSKYDTTKCSINIDDFYYEVYNEQDLKVKIDLILDELYYKDEPLTKEEMIIPDERNNDLFKETTKEEELIIEPKDENANNNLINVENNGIYTDIDTSVNIDSNNVNNPINNKLDDLFKETTNDKEYSVYRVYTVLDGETLEYILDKYKVTRDDIIPYNDLDNFKPGMKLIIPSIDE